MPSNTPALVVLHRLTLRGLSGMVEAPNHTRRSKRLSRIPNAGRSLAVQSAFAVKVPAWRLSGGLLSHIGGVVTSSIREDWRPCMSRGALRPRPFFIPNHTRYPMTNTHSPAVNGHELTPNTATACRRAFRRRSTLRLPEDRAEQPCMPAGSACLADRPTAAPAPSLHAEALAAREALQRAAAGLGAFRQALAELRRVGYALLPRLCADEGYASPIARPFIGDVLDAALYDAERQLTDAHDKAIGQAALLCRVAREVEKAGEVCHA